MGVSASKNENKARKTKRQEKGEETAFPRNVYALRETAGGHARTASAFPQHEAVFRCLRRVGKIPIQVKRRRKNAAIEKKRKKEKAEVEQSLSGSSSSKGVRASQVHLLLFPTRSFPLLIAARYHLLAQQKHNSPPSFSRVQQIQAFFAHNRPPWETHLPLALSLQKKSRSARAPQFSRLMRSAPSGFISSESATRTTTSIERKSPSLPPTKLEREIDSACLLYLPPCWFLPAH